MPPLNQFATARSGDKGNHANIGVVAFSERDYDHLLQSLTADLVERHFHGLELDRVERFELPNVWALNFILYAALGGGASESLRIDTQGKLLATSLLEVELPDR